VAVFDVYARLPLALALAGLGKSVHLANLSFSELNRIGADDWCGPNLAAIRPATIGEDGYFPERTLARWLDSQGMNATVYAFPRTGVRPVQAAYRDLIRRLAIDAIVLVDGGTDILAGRRGGPRHA
jgi:hypothetical protein